MVKHIDFVSNGLENTSSLTDAAIVTEQTYKLGLEEVFMVEAILDDER